MRIAIDMDDTLVSTFGNIKKIIEESYGTLVTANYRDWTEQEKIDFMKKYDRKIFYEAKLYDGVKKIMNKLKKDGYELWLVTARNNAYSNNAISFTNEFIKKHQLPFDKLNYGISPKGKFCKENNIKIIIDDSPFQCSDMINHGGKAILFDSDFNKESKLKRANNWFEVYEMIKKMGVL